MIRGHEHIHPTTLREKYDNDKTKEDRKKIVQN